MTTANNAWSTHLRRPGREGKNEPVRSFGIRNSRSPAIVVRVLGRDPLRWVVRALVRSNGAAPMAAAASASTGSWYRRSVAERIWSDTSVTLS